MTDQLTLNGILSEIGSGASGFDIRLEDCVSSTNTVLKELAAKEAESGIGALRTPADAPWTVLIADRQTAGRGRMGRSFESPAGTGIYLSVLFRQALPAEGALAITTAAAVAACRAIEECTDEEPSIKWVNDVWVRGKKVCGILTEGSADPSAGLLRWAVMGIGFNVYEPQNGFSDAVKDVAGIISPKPRENLRNRLSGAFLRHLESLLRCGGYSDEYKRRSFIPGSMINVIRGGVFRPALALDIDDRCRLLVRYEDGSTEALSSGEVSIRPNN